MKKTIFVFALLIVSLFTIFEISKYSITFVNSSIEYVITIIAVLFFIVGIYISRKSLNKAKKKLKQLIFRRLIN